MIVCFLFRKKDELIMILNCNMPNKGEWLVKEYLERNGYDVIDVSKNKEYWVQDVDFIAVKGEKQTKIEVKYDGWIYKTRNMFIELLTDIDKNKCGWIDYCKADVLFYVDAITHICYVVKLKDIRDYINKYSYQTKISVDTTASGQIYKCSKGALINIDMMSIMYDVEIISLEY